jgi:hypothetical protein
LKEDRIGDEKNGDIRADPERERRDRCEGELGLS